MVAFKSLALSLSKISPEFLIDQNRFLPDLSHTFSQYLTLVCLLKLLQAQNSLWENILFIIYLRLFLLNP